MKFRYEKCIKCPKVCHCCASYHKEGWPRCNECREEQLNEKLKNLY